MGHVCPPRYNIAPTQAVIVVGARCESVMADAFSTGA